MSGINRWPRAIPKIESDFGCGTVFGIPDVGPPAVEDGIDRPAAPDLQIDRLADLVLAAVRGVDQFAGGKDRWPNGVKYFGDKSGAITEFPYPANRRTVVEYLVCSA